MKIYFFVPALLSAGLFISGCGSDTYQEPIVSFDSYTVAEGFEIQLIASEPFVEAPVAMDFDDKGRIWVVEMPAYMPNIEGIGEDQPTGTITILEDRDKDGITDHSKVFIDSLVLPRAIALVYGGLLYVEPPNLWFVEINNDKPGKRTLVDSLYSDGGNVEMQPNGLLMNIDNWIYNAKLNYRYQLRNGQWKKEITSSRGQWGISKDNAGRLYYNNNVVQAIGDYTIPNTFIRNPYQQPKSALDIILTDDQRVYPLHPTTVNRGGEKGILDKDSLLVAFTAACAPLVYRGDQFPEDYRQNLFVCEPEGNLVKRNLLEFGGARTIAKQAWSRKEFLASTDEGFRPVNLFNAPDGALYVADMHRGIMQHKAYMTPYYTDRIAGKKLDTLTGMGRILRIKNKNKPLTAIPDWDKLSSNALVDLLGSENGWIRDRAQQMLIRMNDRATIPQLEGLAKSSMDEITVMHVLHTLNGMEALSINLLREATATKRPMITAHALLLLEQFAAKEQVETMKKISADLLAGKDTTEHLYLALALGPWVAVAPETFLPVLSTISSAYADRPMYQEAVISSIAGWEERFRNDMQTAAGAANSLLPLLDKTIRNKQEDNKNDIFVKIELRGDVRSNGLELFRTTCATCHGPGGNGIENLAPPLKNSEYVSGPVDRLAMIILNGIQGPVHVNGKRYEMNGSMPGFAANFTDKQIADIISYLHNAFVAHPPGVEVERIQQLRKRKQGTLTEQDLLKMHD